MVIGEIKNEKNIFIYDYMQNGESLYEYIKKNDKYELLKKCKVIYIPNIIKTCDINILSSHYEGFGLVAVESMASGIPTIVSNVDGLKDVVGNGGILFTKGDHIELKEKILNIYENKENYNRIRESGIKQSELYNIDNMIKSLNNIYNEVVLK